MSKQTYRHNGQYTAS